MLPKSFEQYKFKEFINEAIVDLHFSHPTMIQQRVMPQVLKGKSLIGQSQTGTGKSHAFLLPLINRIDSTKSQVQVVILAPTRELAKQLFDATQHILSFEENIKAALYIGGTDKHKDIEKSKVQPQIIIGTPTRINDLATDIILDLHEVNSIVVDEADLMLDLGFLEDVDKILSKQSEKAQLLVFSATIPVGLKPFLNKYLENPEFIQVNPMQDTTKNITNYLVAIKGASRDEKLLQVMSTLNPYLAIIFANKRETVDHVVNIVSEAGYKVGIIHGGLTPRERTQMMKRIRNLEFQYVIASDLASRGIDIDGVSHVINYEIPKDVDFFIHRIGRTGRGNLKGESITLYSTSDEYLLTQIEQKKVTYFYAEPKNGELVLVKDRHERMKRVKKTPDGEIHERLKRKVKSAKKVKPGYKKKYKYKLDKLKQKERRKFAKSRGRNEKRQ